MYAHLQSRITGEKPQILEQLETAVMLEYKLSSADLWSRSRRPHSVYPRQIFFFLAHEALKFSYPHLGQLYDRDHTTIIHACEAVKRRDEVGLAYGILASRMPGTGPKRP